MSIADRVAAAGGELLRFEASPPRNGVRYVACVPVRDEAERVGACLDALDREFGSSLHTVMLVNDCDDASMDVICGRMPGRGGMLTAAAINWRDSRGTAPRARSLAFEIAREVAPEALLFSTDADTIVCPGLMAAYDAAFAQGFDLVCGRIGFLAGEVASLPAVDPRRDAAIRAYRDATRHILALAFPDPGNPWPHHGNIGGANFAITAAAYRIAGPVPLVAFGEDRALRRSCEAHGLRIAYVDAARVETSCRLDSRTEGGLAAELARNRIESDPLVDEALEPPSKLVRRMRLRHLVTTCEDRAGVASALTSGGMTSDRAHQLADMPARPLAWFHAEAELAVLRRERMRFSQMARHLPALLRFEAKIAEARSDKVPEFEG
ncbi:glycosyltransferase [Jiella mangrovi]|uniref:Glycosyltransferase n=1 Tax=Jiella mangrovi TaxID=2821407 RepID=A0ABS4BCF5_9HYPH|nr:glycosyltransferase [Jiella mangrovi]MBP0614427.1 glycosyltransferase [Jiella mangrovi]